MPVPAPPPLLGTYTPPPVKSGDVVRCLYRRADCRVTSWTHASIPWPQCKQPGVRGGSGLLVTDELVRAIRTESARALTYWFGIGSHLAAAWRKRFVSGPGKPSTPGSAAAYRRASRIAAAVWTSEQLALLGTAPDAEVARLIGRKPSAVRSKRAALRIPTGLDRRRMKSAAE